ncbi:MAG TPA: RHS repeat-associated core domain-containing protein [Anaerolineae bacterium]|nr:RHS repeat-associated core domain-containing protein [Anaerolineae bacterium]
MPLPQPNTPTSPFGYAGEWTSAATGLQYLRARWYDPATGRFTQVDPFPGVLSLPGTQHPYSYGLNNPLRYSDPSGESVALLVGAAAAYALGYLAYDALVPDVAQGFTAAHVLGYVLGYENIRQDIKTLRNPNVCFGRKVLATLDAVWNAALGISMVHGLLNGLVRTLSLAKTLLKAGPGTHSILNLGQVTLTQTKVPNPFRVPNTSTILVPEGYLNGNKLQALGGLAHEIAHIQQGSGALGKILKPLQKISVATGKFPHIFLPQGWIGYWLNPIEINAAANGLSNVHNLLWVTVAKPFGMGVFNGAINDYDFRGMIGDALRDAIRQVFRMESL